MALAELDQESAPLASGTAVVLRLGIMSTRGRPCGIPYTPTLRKRYMTTHTTQVTQWYQIASSPCCAMASSVTFLVTAPER
jgi:hypothetical protein